MRELFGDWPRQARALTPLPPEPAQIAERVARRTGPYAVTRLEICWHTVAMSHSDAPALDLLAMVVGNGKSSRLAREIKEHRKLAHEISAWSYTPRDPGLFGIGAVCDPDKETAVIQAIQGEVRRWAEAPFAGNELDKARRAILIATLSEFQTVHGQADNFVSGEFYTGSPLYFRTYLQSLERASPESLSAVARKHLRADNCTIAILAPASIQPTQAGANIPATNTPPPLSTMAPVQKITLTNGMSLLFREDHKLPMVWISAVCGGGLVLENETNNGIASLMAELLVRGARGRSADEIAHTVESKGASLSAFSGLNSFGLRAQCFACDTPLIFKTIADCLISPNFAQDELDKRKAIQISIVQQQREDPFFIAREALRQALFPNHPYRFDPAGSRQTIECLGVNQVRDLHARTVVGGNTVLAVFGDLSFDQARALAEKHFQILPAGARPKSGHTRSQAVLPQRIARVEPREQAILLAGFPGVDLLDPRNDCLSILQQALSGLSSELFISIRDKQGLAYYTGAIQQPGLDPGYFALYAGTKHSALQQVEALIRREIERITTRGLRPDELERARQKLIMDNSQRLQLNGELSLECALNELYGKGYAYGFETENRLRKVTTAAVRDAAASLLNTNRMAIAIVEPGTGELKVKN
jgi:zinc protease